MEKSRRKGRPERIRVSLWDDAAGSIPLALPERRTWPAGLMLLAFFAIFAGIAWVSLLKTQLHSVRGVFDLMTVLFEVFWLLGWSVGVVIFGLLAALFLFYRESARLQNGRLVHVPRLGPLKIIVEYDLARLRNLRVEPAGSGDGVRIRFDYGEGTAGLGDIMSEPEAGNLIEIIESAIPFGARAEPAPKSREQGELQADGTQPPPPPVVAAPSPASPSVIALVLANLLPLAGVLFYGWDTASVVVLYWAESAVIGFYTAIKIAIVGKVGAVFAVPFFIGHFGGFMAIHFLLIYAMLVRGPEARGPEPGAVEALLAIFVPVWPALAALFLSHAVSFATNFLGRREYVGETVGGLMSAPYRRILLMQVTLIVGGWVVLALKSPVPVLVLLVLLKIVLDVRTHRREHGRAER